CAELPSRAARPHSGWTTQRPSRHAGDPHARGAVTVPQILIQWWFPGAIMSTDVDGERQRVEAEERELVFERFTNDDALELGLLLVEKARSRQLAIAIDVERGGQRLFHFAAAGTTPDNAAWIERKKNLVKRMFRSSDRKSTRLNSSHVAISYAVFCLKKKK